MLQLDNEHKKYGRLSCRFPTNLPGTTPIIERKVTTDKVVKVRQSNGIVRRVNSGEPAVYRQYLVKTGR